MVHQYCNELDPRTRTNDCFDVAFTKVDVFLANELSFGKVSSRISVLVQLVDLSASRKNG